VHGLPLRRCSPFQRRNKVSHSSELVRVVRSGQALAIYPSQENLDRLIERDRDRFRSAVALASGVSASGPHEEPINALARRFSADLSLAQAAAEAGLEAGVFRERLARSARLAQLGYTQLLVWRGD